jgi:hypothetical protein
LRFYLHYPTLLKNTGSFPWPIPLVLRSFASTESSGAPQVPEGVKSVLRRTRPLMSGVVARSNQTAVWHPHVSSKARLCLVPGSYPSEFAHHSTDQPSPSSRREFVQQPFMDSEGLCQPSSPLWQGSQQRNMDILPPGYPPFNQRRSTPAADDRHKQPDFSHRQPAGDDDGRARMSPPERRGGNQRPSPQERLAYQAPQEEFYRTPQKRDISRRPRRRSHQLCHSLSIP